MCFWSSEGWATALCDAASISTSRSPRREGEPMRPMLNIDALALHWGAPDEVRTHRSTVCAASFDEDYVPMRLWSSEGWATALCDAASISTSRSRRRGNERAHD